LWADLHCHFRQGEITKYIAKHYVSMGCYSIVAMPNTSPPVAKVFEDGDEKFWSIERYKSEIEHAFSASRDAIQCDSRSSENETITGDLVSYSSHHETLLKTNIIVPLYLTKYTTAKMIFDGSKSGLLKAVKYYPPHSTTNSEHGISMSDLLKSDVLKAIEETKTILCIHCEEHDIEDYFEKQTNSEILFFEHKMPQLVELYPNMKIVAEHITTKKAVDFVLNSSHNVVATITPQHLLYTISDLLKTFCSHLYCKPVLKFRDDRDALRKAVTDPKNAKFFAGTDNAPHPRLSKCTDCGCAAGCYVGGIAPQLYADAFEKSGVDLFSESGYNIFKKFMCDIGPDFYNIQKSSFYFHLVRTPSNVNILHTSAGDIVPLPLAFKLKSDFSVSIEWTIKI